MRPILSRMMNILIHPRDEWQVIKEGQATYLSILLHYVAPLAAIPPLAVIAGNFLFGKNLPNALGHLLLTNLLWYCMYVLNVMVAGAIVAAIVTTTDAPWTGLRGFTVASYSFTPLFITGGIAVIPKMGWTIYAAILYSIYLVYLGIMAIAGTSNKRSAGFAVASFLAAAVLVGLMNVGEYFLESLMLY